MRRQARGATRETTSAQQTKANLNRLELKPVQTDSHCTWLATGPLTLKRADSKLWAGCDPVASGQATLEQEGARSAAELLRTLGHVRHMP